MSELSIIAKSAPTTPGVYLFKDKSGAPIYIGKAKNLKNRLQSYFSRDILDRTQQMLSQATSLECIITDNESEALVLESNLIKQHFPKYNIELKDNERFTYILITDEKFPRMLLVRKSRAGKITQKGKAFGPFTSGSAQVLVASTLRKIFRIRTCRLGQKKPCLQYHLGFCTGVCAGLVTPEQYNGQVKKLEAALSGGKKLEQLMEGMEDEMHRASHERHFEKALELRNSLRALSSLSERQKMESLGTGDEDYIYFLEQKGMAYIQMFRQMGGVIKDRKKYEFEIINQEDAIGDFLMDFYQAGGIPRRIFVDSLPASSDSLERYLSVKRGGPASIIAPEKGDKKKLLELLQKNILLEISGHADPAIIELQHELSLPAIPRTIECFDVSNIMGTAVVGSMVQFVNGKPNKSQYRRFKIRSVESQDDVACMREIVWRRYSRLKQEGKSMPDLILIDGGTAQLNAALSVLSEFSLSIPCVSLAKQFEEIYHPDFSQPLRLPRTSAALKLLMHARDEAHRFGISYHRLLRKKRVLS